MKACGARLSVSGGGRHVPRRENDKCASYGSLFIGQSSGTQVETELGDERESRWGPVRPARFVARYGSRPNKFGRSGDAPQNPFDGKGADWGGQFTPRGTTYVFVNVVVAPRYVARLRLGSGGLKIGGLGGGPARVRHQPDAAPRHVHGVRVNAAHAARCLLVYPVCAASCAPEFIL